MMTSFNELILTSDKCAADKRTVNVFFRDDDAADDEPSLRRLLELFGEYALPLTLGIIPATLTTAGAQLLNQTNADRIELVQHGWQHRNHEAVGRKCEFGASRGYAEQFADIERGKLLLSNAFGERLYPAFIPPWNRCTTDTYNALDALNFRVLSQASREPVTGYGFKDISTSLDIFTWREGARMRPAETLVQELAAQCAARETVGILLHHQVMQDDAFDWLAALLDALRAHPAVRWQRLQDLAGESA